MDSGTYRLRPDPNQEHVFCKIPLILPPCLPHFAVLLHLWGNICYYLYRYMFLRTATQTRARTKERETDRQKREISIVTYSYMKYFHFHQKRSDQRRTTHTMVQWNTFFNFVFIKSLQRRLLAITNNYNNKFIYCTKNNEICLVRCWRY